MSTSSVIAIFVFCRPLHTKRMLESLDANSEAINSDCYVFCDGPKEATDGNPVSTAHVSAVNETRQLVQSYKGCRSVTVFTNSENRGLANSIISGVTQVLSVHDRVIVLEDDLVLHPKFLSYMNTALRLFEDNERIGAIHGYCVPAKELPPCFFLRGGDCWGWATWRRSWKHFEPDGTKLLRQLENRRLESAFDLDGAYPYTNMLRNQIAGKIDSWAIRWHASLFLRDMLTLYPGRSLVSNIGLDATGTHCGYSPEMRTRVSEVSEEFVNDMLVHLRELVPEEDYLAKQKIADYFRKHRAQLSDTFAVKLRRRIRGIASRLRVCINETFST